MTALTLTFRWAWMATAGDRHWVRVQEMYQSLRIVEQAMGATAGRARWCRRWAAGLIRPPAGESYVRAREPPGRDWRLSGQRRRRPALSPQGAPAVLLQTCRRCAGCWWTPGWRTAWWSSAPWTSCWARWTGELPHQHWLERVGPGDNVRRALRCRPVHGLVGAQGVGRLQLRYGPTRTGPFGLMQPIADAGETHSSKRTSSPTIRKRPSSGLPRLSWWCPPLLSG